MRSPPRPSKGSAKSVYGHPTNSRFPWRPWGSAGVRGRGTMPVPPGVSWVIAHAAERHRPVAFVDQRVVHNELRPVDAHPHLLADGHPPGGSLEARTVWHRRRRHRGPVWLIRPGGDLRRNPEAVAAVEREAAAVVERSSPTPGSHASRLGRSPAVKLRMRGPTPVDTTARRSPPSSAIASSPSNPTSSTLNERRAGGR